MKQSRMQLNDYQANHKVIHDEPDLRYQLTGANSFKQIEAGAGI